MNLKKKLQSILLIYEKNLFKKDGSHLKIAWHSKRLKKNIEKRKRKTKKSQTTRKNNFHFTKINRKNTKTVLKYNADIKNASVKNANVKKNHA